MTTYLLVGGDRRQAWLARLLEPRGRVFTLSVPERPDCLPDAPVDVLLLPVPSLTPDGRIRAAGEPLLPSVLAPWCDEHTQIFGGALKKAFPLGGRCPSAHTGADEAGLQSAEPPESPAVLPTQGTVLCVLEAKDQQELVPKHTENRPLCPDQPTANNSSPSSASLCPAPSPRGEGFSVTDLLADPAFAAANGRLTAEAAVALTAAHREASLFGTPCLILGWGSIAKPLAALLTALHAPVTVAARRLAALAETAQLGCNPFPLGDKAFPLGGRCPSAHTGADEGGPQSEGLPAVVFNTIPAPVLPPASIPPTALWVELASAPGGLPAGFEPPFEVLPAPGLPGRFYPRSAAALIADAVGAAVCRPQTVLSANY